MAKPDMSGAGEFRKKAEARLKIYSGGEQSLQGDDTLSLLHELQVHQIELELQNEELKEQRDRAETALRRYSDLFAEIYDFTPVPYFSFSYDGRIIELNLKASELLGYERSFLTGKRFLSFMPADMRGPFNEFLQKIFRRREKARLEVQIYRRDRSLVHSILEGTLSENENKCLAMALEISDLKKIESDLRQAQDMLRESTYLVEQHLLEIESIYKNIPVGLCVLDLDLKFVRINDRLAEINGIPAGDHIGKHVSEVLPLYADKAESILKGILETGEPHMGIDFTGPTPAQPDTIRSFSEDWMPLRNPDGKIIGINVVVIETTKEKKAKEKLLENEKKLIIAKNALEQANKKLNITLKNARIGTWEWNVRSKKLTFDRRTEEIFRLKPGAFEGTLQAFENLVHEDDLPFVRKAVEKALSGKPEKIVFRTRPVDEIFSFVSWSSVVIRDRQGKPVKISGVCFDITDLKTETDQTLRRINEELAKSNSDLQQFAYVASHDLQEPLRMVSSFVQLLQLRYQDKLDEDADEYIRFAVEGTKRMYELINGLLSFSRVHTGSGDFREVRMNDVVEKVMENLRIVIKERDAVVSHNDLPVIMADENQMVQLLQNLVENGIKFSPEKPRITISSAENGDNIIFSVKDEGIGIEPQYFDKIFKIFQKLHTSSEYPGTGIGLAICKRIVDRHNGSIWVESRPGSGTTVFFSIPKSRS